MDFALTEGQEMLRKTARDFLDKECPRSFVKEMEEDEAGYSPSTWRKTADLGWSGLRFPEKYGGLDGSLIDLAVLYEEMGRVMYPSPHLSTVVLCGSTILYAGNQEQKTEYLPKITRGDLILALALTEPEASWNGQAWDAEGVTVHAKRDGDAYVIDGTKLFVHDANVADYLLCVTRTDMKARAEEGITLFLVDAKSPGIRHSLLQTISGDKQFEVVFDSVRVAKNNIVGEVNGGWPHIARVLQEGAVMLCAEMVGAGQRLLELTVDYAKTRVQFDQPIGVNQYVQEHCVYLLREVEGSRWSTYQAAWRLSNNLNCDMEIAIAKAWTSDAHEEACWRAHQVFAGAGYMSDDSIIPMYSRRGKVQQLYLGDSTYHLRKVAEQLARWPSPKRPFGKPLGLWKMSEEEQKPAWQPWRERWDSIQRRKEKRQNRGTQPRI